MARSIHFTNVHTRPAPPVSFPSLPPPRGDVFSHQHNRIHLLQPEGTGLQKRPKALPPQIDAAFGPGHGGVAHLVVQGPPRGVVPRDEEADEDWVGVGC